MEEAFRAALLAYGGLAALVGTRIDWGLRSDPLPGIRLQVVSKIRIYTYRGPIGLTPYRIQADCFGVRYGDAKRVARAFEAAVHSLSRPTWDACFVEAERDDQEDDGTGKPVHRTSLDARIWYQP